MLEYITINFSTRNTYEIDENGHPEDVGWDDGMFFQSFTAEIWGEDENAKEKYVQAGSVTGHILLNDGNLFVHADSYSGEYAEIALRICNMRTGYVKKKYNAIPQFDELDIFMPEGVQGYAAFIEDFNILTPYRGQGVGKQVIAALVDILEARFFPLAGIYLLLGGCEEHTPEAAKKVYKHAGFKEIPYKGNSDCVMYRLAP